VAVGNDYLWARFCKILGVPELIDDPRFRTNPLRVKNRKACIAILADIMKTRPGDEWLEMLIAEAIPCAPINRMDEVFKDPQVLHRDMLVEVDHPTAGKVKMVGIPVKYSETKAGIYLPPPLLGQHSRDILSQLLGYDNEKIDALQKESVI
jgi:crotonobetainyl-CoA:carnitine CoA-transferase CaiB-like acyl-CoA transferase